MNISLTNAPEPRQPVRRRRPLTLKKKGLFSGVVALTIYLASEVVALTVLCWQHQTWSRVHDERQAIAARNPFQSPGVLARPVMIHPYLGYVLQPKDDVRQPAIPAGSVPDPEVEPQSEYWITNFGFMDNQPPLHKRSADRIIVAIQGGSVARKLATNATAVLEAELSSLPEFRGKHFQFVRLAVDGYKQPQQLLTLNYLMSLGAEFDIVINLDGVNEAALPQQDNVRYGVSAVYPRQWSSLLAIRGNAEAARRVGYVAYLRLEQRDRAAQSACGWLGHSPVALLVWKVLHDRSANHIRDQTTLISALSTRELSFAASGPKETFDSDEHLFDHCVELWAHSSELMARLCAAHGIRYFHLLQPNQYLSGSKPMNTIESRLALNKESPFQIPVQRCYPKMRAAADRLRHAGVSFGDLTQVFANHPELLYSDDCCHLNEAGDTLLAKAIASHIRAAWHQPEKEIDP